MGHAFQLIFRLTLADIHLKVLEMFSSKYEQTLISTHFGRLMPFDLSRWDWIASGHLLFSQSSINFTSMHLTPNLSALNFWYFLVWLELKEKSQPKKSFYFLQPLFENIFWHNYPRQFKVQIPTGLDHNKWSFYRQLSSSCLVIDGIIRYIGLSANRHAKNSRLCQVTSWNRKMMWGIPKLRLQKFSV